MNSRLLIAVGLVVALFIGLSAVTTAGEGGVAQWAVAATPTPQPAAITVDETTGGVLQSTDAAQSVLVNVPVSAVTTTTTISYTYQADLPTAPLAHVRRFFTLRASQNGKEIGIFHSPILLRPMEITVTFDAPNPLVDSTIALYWLQGNRWLTHGVTVTRRSPYSLTVETRQVALFAVLGETNWVYLPLLISSK